MKIALVHEFLTQLGGAERVLENFLEIWPDATLYVLVSDPKKTGAIFGQSKIKTSFVDKLPMAHQHHKLYLALMPAAVGSFNFSDYDVILSDSSSFAKGAKARGKLHVCYCHTPTRFLWTERDYLQTQPYPGVLKMLAKPVLRWLKSWDFQAAQRPNFFIANSANVQSRIKKYYGRDSEVIFPPVDTEIFHPEGQIQDYYLAASRLEPYKKIRLVIEAFNELGLPLKVAGTGTELENLRKIARPNIEFVGRVEDDNLRWLYSGAQAYVFPANEDAGIMMLEAQACGTPVIAFKAGGALELVRDGATGILFGHQTKDSIKHAIGEFQKKSFDRSAIRQFALQFDKKIFQKKIKELVESKWQEFKKY
jgi:glycosyltransferase involved in cell wall biosynthesis